jgi:hypothetical protein
MTGNIAIRETEAVLRDWEASAGLPLLTARRWTRPSARSLARAIHLQQYYVSLRYPGSVLPIARMSSESGLHQLIWRYLSEELGHEQFEMEACTTLGIKRADVCANCPLPAFAAFHRVVTRVADVDGLAWVLSLALAEGLPGERKPLPGLLANHGLLDTKFSSHVDLDCLMGHAWMARRMASQLPRVATAVWMRAMQYVRVLWSLTRAGWEQLANFYGRPRFPGIVSSPWEWISLLELPKQAHTGIGPAEGNRP